MTVKTRYTEPIVYGSYKCTNEEYHFETLKDCIRFICGRSGYWVEWDIYVKMGLNEEPVSVDDEPVCFLALNDNLWILAIGNLRVYYNELTDEIVKILA